MNSKVEEHKLGCPFCFAAKHDIPVSALGLGAVELWKWQKEHREMLNEA